MKYLIFPLITLFAFIGCSKTSPIVTVSKTDDGKFEQIVSNYYCDMYGNNYRTIKNDSTDIINDTDICSGCGRKFSEHESTGEHYQKQATDNSSWL